VIVHREVPLNILNPDFPLDPSLMKLLAIPLSRQKTAASGWLSRAGGNLAKNNTSRSEQHLDFVLLCRSFFQLDSRLRGNDGYSV
jgi:hypothetical protein